MEIQILPSRAEGTVTAPPSKSMAHRLLICAAMAKGTSLVSNLSPCEDVSATLRCLTAMGIETESAEGGTQVTVRGAPASSLSPKEPLYCKESGSTLRFLLPLALLSGKEARFVCDPGLRRRPMTVYEELAREHGFVCQATEEGYLAKGPLPSGTYTVRGNVSSQFISGLLFALPLCEGDSVIRIKPPVESRSYIELTLRALSTFGITVRWLDEYTLSVPGGQCYCPREVTVEGDYSATAFLEAFNLLGGSVQPLGLDPQSAQGDRVYRELFPALERGAPSIHVGDCPDLSPILFAMAAAKHGAVFSGTARLRIKESDRATAMAEELRKLGVSVSVYEDSVVIYPLSLHPPATPLCGHGDHRIVMALAVLLSAVGGNLTDTEAVAKSYPRFFEDIRALGITYREVTV